AQRAALLSALVVVGHDHRVLVQQRGLEAAVGTDKGAGLLTEAREDAVEQERKKRHEDEAGQMMARVVELDGQQLAAADDVGEQGVADDERQAEEDDLLEQLLEDLARAPRS